MLSICHVFTDHFYVFFGEITKMWTFTSKDFQILILELHVKENAE